MQWGRSEIIGFLQVHAGIHEQPHEVSMPLVTGPVQSGVTIDVRQVILGAHSEEKCGCGRSSIHAGCHQWSQSFQIGCVDVDTRLKENLNHTFRGFSIELVPILFACKIRENYLRVLCGMPNESAAVLVCPNIEGRMVHSARSYTASFQRCHQARPNELAYIRACPWHAAPQSRISQRNSPRRSTP